MLDAIPAFPAWRQVLSSGLVVSEPNRAACERIITEVAAEAGLSFADLIGPSRCRAVAWPRQIAMWRIRNEVHGVSLPQIGRVFKRDHTTVIYAIRAVDARIKETTE